MSQSALTKNPGHGKRDAFPVAQGNIGSGGKWAARSTRAGTPSLGDSDVMADARRVAPSCLRRV